MKARISALMDGEAGPHESAGPLDTLRVEGEAREAWRNYHLIGDAMRDTRILSAGFSGRVAARLAQEPTVMAPSRSASSPQRPRLQLFSAAASLAAVALVGWFAFGPQETAVQVAQVTPTTAQAPSLPTQAAAPAAQVPPPASANEYLYAHQGYSPRNSLQGIAPYVRMVSGETRVQQR
jgi:sigma-E factor negative regulatory protein RseA